LITAHIRLHDGDVEAGLVTALSWMAQSLPVYSLNLLLATPTTLWAVRYPDTNELHVLRRARNRFDSGGLDVTSPRIHARSDELTGQAATVIASEPMDGDPRWRPMQPGELIRIDADQSLHSSFPLPLQLTQQLTLEDLGPVAATSQSPGERTAS
jgi:predicted glutamine amidotransferase